MRRRQPAAAGTPQLRRDFWQAFKTLMETTSDIGCSRVSSDGWLWHSAGLSAGYLASIVNVRERELCVWFRVNEANADTVFSYLQSRRAEVDDAFVEAPTWRPGGGSSHVIEVRRRDADIRERSAWPEYMAWLQSRLETFQGTLWPLVGRVPPMGERKQWDEELFFAELRRWNPACLAPARLLLRWASDRGEEVQWGKGGQSGSFTPAVVHHGVAYRLVSARTDGTVVLPLNRLKDTPLFEEREQRLELLEQVNRMRHLRLPETTLDGRPTVPLALFSDPVAAGQLVELLDWFRGRVRPASSREAGRAARRRGAKDRQPDRQDAGRPV